MSIINNPFSASSITLGAQNIMSSANLLQTYALAVVSQAEAKIPEIPGFVTDQQTAIKNAESIQIELIPALVAMASHGLAISNLFSAEYDALLSHAIVIDNATLPLDQRKKAADTFSKGISVLIQSVTSGDAQVKSTINWITFFLDLIKKDSLALDNDLKIAEKALKKDRIDKLHAELESILQKLEADNERISKGAINGLVSAAQISLGIIVSYYKGPGEGFEMIVSGIKGAAKESSDEQKALDDVNVQFQRYSSVITELLSAEAIYGVVKTLSHMDKLLFSNVNTSQLSIKAYSDASSHFIEGLLEVQKNLAKNELPLTTQFATDLKEAKLQWSTLHTQIVNFQSSGIIQNPKQALNEKTSVNHIA